MASLKLALGDTLSTVIAVANTFNNTIGMIDDGVTGCRHYTRAWSAGVKAELDASAEEQLAAVATERRLSIAQRQLSVNKQLEKDPQLRALFDKLHATPAA